MTNSVPTDLRKRLEAIEPLSRRLEPGVDERAAAPIGDDPIGIERALMRDGRVLLSSTLLNGERFLRFSVLSLRTHRDEVEQAVEIVGAAAATLGQE